jgi:hypothetical protein
MNIYLTFIDWVCLNNNFVLFWGIHNGVVQDCSGMTPYDCVAGSWSSEGTHSFEISGAGQLVMQYHTSEECNPEQSLF